jgi:hypothetical protein
VLAPDLFEDLQGGFGIGRALHIDLDAIVQRRGGGGDLMSQRKAQFAIEIQAQLRQFDGDIAVDSGFTQRTQHLHIAVSRFSRLV